MQCVKSKIHLIETLFVFEICKQQLSCYVRVVFTSHTPWVFFH